jgi:hypothetical protein
VWFLVEVSQRTRQTSNFARLEAKLGTEYGRPETHGGTGLGIANCWTAGRNGTVMESERVVLVEPAMEQGSHFGREGRFDVVWEVEVHLQPDTGASEATWRQHWCFECLQ